MSELLKKIRNEIDSSCFVKGRLSKDGCRVKLNSVPESRIVIDFDKRGSPLSSNAVRCDYLAIVQDTNTDFVIPLELMRGELDSDKVVVQLQAGANIAQNHIPRNQVVSFRPVAVTGSAPKHERQELRRRSNRIKFHENFVGVERMSCGNSISSVIRFES